MKIPVYYCENCKSYFLSPVENDNEEFFCPLCLAQNDFIFLDVDLSTRNFYDVDNDKCYTLEELKRIYQEEEHEKYIDTFEYYLNHITDKNGSCVELNMNEIKKLL